MVPFGFFISLSANDMVLPTIGEQGEYVTCSGWIIFMGVRWGGGESGGVEGEEDKHAQICMGRNKIKVHFLS